MIGIIGYTCRTGLGIMVHEMRKHLRIEKQLVIPHSNFPLDPEWASFQFVSQTWTIEKDTLQAWIEEEGIKTVISIESPFGQNTFRWAKELGCRVILLPMWEYFNPHVPDYRNVDLYVCVSYKCYQEVPFENKIYLPWPVDTEEFKFIERSGPAQTFIHNAGTGGVAGRKGTAETVQGFYRSRADAKLIVRTQFELPADIEKLGEGESGTQMEVVVEQGSVRDKAQLYETGDVLIYPSHYDGHALVTAEGMAAGMPVITTDAAPMNEFFESGYPLLVRVAQRRSAETINPHCERNLVDLNDLAHKIKWATEHDMGPISRRNREIIEEDHSWTVLKKRWEQVLE